VHSFAFLRGKFFCNEPHWFLDEGQPSKGRIMFKKTMTFTLVFRGFLQESILFNLVMGPGQKFLTQVGSGQVSYLWFVFEFGKFHLKMSNFSIFFPSHQKNLFRLGQKVSRLKAGWPLIYCGSKVSSGRVRAHLYHLCILLFRGIFTINKFIKTRIYKNLEWLQNCQLFANMSKIKYVPEFCKVTYMSFHLSHRPFSQVCC